MDSDTVSPMSLLEDDSFTSSSSVSGSSFDESEEKDRLEQVEDISESTIAAPEVSTETVPVTPAIQEYALWAWPLNEDGFVRAWSKKDKFSVALDFKYLLAKGAEVKKFDPFKAGGSSFTFTIGLCSIKRADLSFWRLEVHLFTYTDMILVEVFREVFHDYANIESVRKSKTLRKLRKTYRLPSRYDIATATVNINDALGAIVIEALPKAYP